jgi:hypothetical protein
MRHAIDNGGDPEHIVDAIVAAATRQRPRFRWRVGKTARLAAWGKRLLPGGLFERLLQREFGVV